MSLSCSCDYEPEFDAGDWYYDWDNERDFVPLTAKRRKRCCSCGELININSLCIKYPRRRYPWNDIEARIVGCSSLDDSFCDEAPIRIAPHYHCEKCGEIWLNLTAIGYECLSPSESMADSLKEYLELTGFKRG